MQILEYYANRLFPNFQGIALFTFVAPQVMGTHRSDGWQESPVYASGSREAIVQR
jgi:hypothetical protein